MLKRLFLAIEMCVDENTEKGKWAMQVSKKEGYSQQVNNNNKQQSNTHTYTNVYVCVRE